MAHEAEGSLKENWVVIGISGVTCGGKTSLANRLKNTLSPIYIFHQDNYFYPDDSPHHVPCKDLPHNNYDILSSLDMKRMHDDVLETMRGVDKAHEGMMEGGLTVEGRKFLVMEGFSVLNYKPLMELCDFRCYLTLEYGECASRRARRRYEPPDVAGYFEACVWPQHLLYRAEIEKDPRVKLVDAVRQDAFDMVLADLTHTYTLREHA